MVSLEFIASLSEATKKKTQKISGLSSSGWDSDKLKSTEAQTNYHTYSHIYTDTYTLA